MTTTLTTPISVTVTKATVDAWDLRVARVLPGLTVNLADSRFDVTVVNRLASGVEVSRTEVQFPLSEVSAGTLTVLRNFHLQVIAYVKANGALPAGTDTADL